MTTRAKYVTALLLSFSLEAANRTVTLTWQDGQNPAGTTYNIYRAKAACSTAPTFTLVASVATLTYVDPVTPGKYCYYVTALWEADESDPSNSADVDAKPFRPTGLQQAAPTGLRVTKKS